MSIRQKINIKSIGIFSLIVFIVLIFFSRTIYGHNLPLVTAAMPFRGRLHHMEVTTGIARHESLRDLHAQLGGTVEQVLVREGEFVEKGQPIFEMSFGDAPEDAERNLQALGEDTQRRANEDQIARNRLQLDIERTNADIQRITNNMARLRSEEFEKDIVSDFELAGARQDFESARREYESSRALYEVGAISLLSLTQAEESLRSAENRYEHLISTWEDSVSRAAESLYDKERARQRQLDDYAFQLENLQRDLQARTLDLNNLSVQEAAGRTNFENRSDTYMRSLQNFAQNQVIYAPVSGVVLSVSVNEGQFINANQLLISFGILEGGFIVDANVSLGNNFIAVGDTCRLSNATHSFNGVVTNITPLENVKRITISVDGEGITAGETFEIRFEKESAETYVLVPNGAINRDSDGYFLNQIRRRDGILGREFYTERLRVMIGDSDLDYTVITRGITFFTPIALFSDRAFFEGETINLQNERDFFDN